MTAGSVGAGGWLFPVFLLCASAQAFAQAPQARPDPRALGGVWTNANMTPVTRPAGETRRAVPAAEARRIAEGGAILGFPRDPGDFVDRIDPDAPAPAAGAADFGLKGYNSFWLATGDNLARVKGEYRTSNVVDPPDGQIPWRANRPRPNRPRGGNFLTGEGLYDGPEYLTLAERCLIGFSGASGPGMFTPIYNNTYQFVLTDDHFVILSEMVHDARIIPIHPGPEAARAARRPAALRPWLGDSVAWWEADALVVETVGLHPLQAEQGQIPLSQDGRITERFQRWAEDEIFYAFTVEDPVHYTRAWTVENSFRPHSRLYEYACHEGNYAMPGILAGARRAEAETARAATRAR